MAGLGRVNLLVGTNNCGKTSILECIELLRSSGNRNALSFILSRRGEWGYLGEEDRQAYLEVRHLFSNRDLRREVSIQAERTSTAIRPLWNEKLSLSVEQNQQPQFEIRRTKYD